MSSGAAVPDPNISEVVKTSTAYRGADCNDPQGRFYIFGTLTSGVLKFEVVAELPDGTRGSVSGRRFFAAMMNHFGAAVRVIEGNWSRASGLLTNITTLNQATAAGLTIKQAAPLTKTGIYADSYSYSEVPVQREVPQGAQGNYDEVVVYFSRP